MDKTIRESKKSLKREINRQVYVKIQLFIEINPVFVKKSWYAPNKVKKYKKISHKS